MKEIHVFIYVYIFFICSGCEEILQFDNNPIN